MICVTLRNSEFCKCLFAYPIKERCVCVWTLWSVFCPSPRPLQPGAEFQTSKQKRRRCRDGEVGLVWGTGTGAGTQRRRDMEQNQRQQTVVCVCRPARMKTCKQAQCITPSALPLYVRVMPLSVLALCFCWMLCCCCASLTTKGQEHKQKVFPQGPSSKLWVHNSKRRKVWCLLSPPSAFVSLTFYLFWFS